MEVGAKVVGVGVDGEGNGFWGGFCSLGEMGGCSEVCGPGGVGAGEIAGEGPVEGKKVGEYEGDGEGVGEGVGEGRGERSCEVLRIAQSGIGSSSDSEFSRDVRQNVGE